MVLVDPSCPEMLLARAEYARGSHQKALELASACLKQQPNSIEARLLLGEMALGQPGGAALTEKLAMQVFAIDERSVAAHRLLASSLKAQGRGEEARHVLTRALSLQPADLEMLLSLATVCRELKQGAAEETALRQAIRHHPRSGRAALDLSAALSRRARKADAAAVLAQAVARQAADPDPTLELVRLQESNGQVANAIAVAKQALVARRQGPSVMHELGDVLKRHGELRSALVAHRYAAGCMETELPPIQTPLRRALFIAQTPSSWEALASVYGTFAQDPQWDVTVVAAPFLHCSFSTTDQQNEIFGFFEREGIPHVRWDAYALTPGCADIAFVYIPYEETLPRGWKLRNLLCAVPRIVYVPYAFVVIGGTEINELLFNLPFQRQAWLVVASSERNKAMYRRYCATGDAHVVVAGHPKVDGLRRADSSVSPVLQDFIGDRPMVCWNPHFDVRPDGSEFGSGFSTFLYWHDILLDEFSRRSGFAFVMRPHPLLFSSLRARGIWSDVEIAQFRERARSCGNVLIDETSSYLPVFQASVAMISDASSLLIEYSILEKPLAYLRNPKSAGLNDDGELLKNCLYTAEAKKDVVAFLEMLTCRNDPKALLRKTVLSELVHCPAQGIANALKAEIEDRLAAECNHAAFKA